MKTICHCLRWLVCLSAWVGCAHAQSLSPLLQEKLNAKFAEIEAWAAQPVLVSAVRTQNAHTPPGFAEMNQEQWRGLPVLDPFVRQFTKSEAADYLKTLRGEVIAELFVSDAAGRKVAFLAKTTNWSHLGKPKHDLPMAGKRWTGPIEVDESSGQKQIQISVPVMDEGKPIGSLVVGLNIFALAK